MVQHQASSAAVVDNVTVKTALGADVFQVRSFRFRDRLGEPFEGLLELQSGADSVDLGALLGGEVTVTVTLPQGSQRYFNGIILEASQEAAAGDTTRYRLVMGPPGQDVATPYTNAQGSLRLQFRWDRYGQSNDKSSAWVRCSQFWAGPSWGAVFLPRLGCEVAVAFEGGDPDRPLVIGSLYNGDNSPPLSLPSDAQKLIVKDDGGNSLQFTPTAGDQVIEVYSPTDDTKLQIGKN